MSNIGDMLVDVKGLKSVHDSIKNTFSTKQELTNVDNKFSEVNSARQSGNGTTYDNLKARLDADKEAIETDIGELKADLKDNQQELGFAVKNFSKIAGSNHSSTADKLDIAIKSGQKFYVTVSQTGSGSEFYYQLFGWHNGVSTRILSTPKTSVNKIEITASSDYEQLSVYVGNDMYAGAAEMTLLCEQENSKLAEIETLKNDIDVLEKKSDNVKFPLLRNGSVGNSGNANAVTSHYILPIHKKYDRIYVEFIGDSALANQYGLAYCLFRGASDEDTTTETFLNASVTKKQVNSDFNIAPLYSIPRIAINISDISDYDHISVCMFRKLNGTFVPIRIATDQYSLKVSYEYNPDIPVRGIDTDDVSHISDNARHVKGNSGTPLTLLHFSDLHSDVSALARIMADAEKYSLDGKICTGDMVANNYGEITSWWDASVMTVIGNHDSASYDSSTGYNWTALSMANRDAYYITPFESNWGVTHTTGKSYYYKDYSAQKVRLIVMDGMLYSDNGADATEQTAWLADLLADAITNNLHVVIAIHAPHGGAVPVECSFTRYGQGAMPTYSDCNTPQVVIDAVATAIGNGLHFIGYLVGHTHQDNIWDAEDDAKQLMYCITCANQKSIAQWKNSDQDRSNNIDAYNLVTIDTTNTLVKIVRGGGADIDDHMRTRKAICIDYSTGDVVGEVL